MSQQLYATIRPGTRYENQCNGNAFPVQFVPDDDGYCWKGGPGGRYRNSDLWLFKMGDDQKLHSVPLMHSEEGIQLIDIILKGWENSAADGHLYPEWMSEYGDQLIDRIRKLQAKAADTYPEEEEDC